MDLTTEFVAEEFRRLGAIPAKETTWKEIEGVVYACPVGVLTEYITEELRSIGASVNNWITRECEVERKYQKPYYFWQGVASEWDGTQEDIYSKAADQREDYQAGRQFAREVIKLVGEPLTLPDA